MIFRLWNKTVLVKNPIRFESPYDELAYRVTYWMDLDHLSQESRALLTEAYTRTSDDEKLSDITVSDWFEKAHWLAMELACGGAE